MKTMFHDDDSDDKSMDRAKLIVSIVPVILIIIILAITLIINGSKKEKAGEDDLQQSIMDYADGTVPAGSDSVQAGETDGEVKREPVEAKEDEGQMEQDEDSPETAASPDPSPTPYKQAMDPNQVDYSKVEFNKDEQLKEMMTYWADNNQKALDDLANLDRFKAMSWKLKGTKDCYYYGDKNGAGQPEGMGIAVYTDNQYYYGEWKNGVRSGKGTWIHYHIHGTENKNDVFLYHQYTGSWANDLPDGEGSEHYDFEMSLLKEHNVYYGNLIGSYAGGLVNGDFYLTTLDYKQEMKEWNGKADHGSWIYQNDNKDKSARKPALVSTVDPDNYVWLSSKENKDIGVRCLISKQKN